MNQSGFVLPSFGVQLMVVGGIILATNLFTAIKVADYVQDQNDLQNLKATVAVVEREKVIEVLDKKTLETHLAKQRAEFEKRLENERVINVTIERHEATPDKPWCELDARELRLWNLENDGYLIDDDKRLLIERGKGVPGEAAPSQGGKDRGPVAKQIPNP